MTDETRKFKDGDVVRLKSGGPAMTVAARPPDKPGVLLCTWWNGPLGDFTSRPFVEHMLCAAQANVNPS